jgi:hypothetical protein
MLSRLTRLRELNLCGSFLTSLPPTVSCLQLLERLNVSYCKLHALPKELASVRSLAYLDATFNPLQLQSLLLPLCLSPIRGKLLSVLRESLLNPTAAPFISSDQLFQAVQSCLPAAMAAASTGDQPQDRNAKSEKRRGAVSAPDKQALKQQRESIWFSVATEAICRRLWQQYVEVLLPSYVFVAESKYSDQ